MNEEQTNRDMELNYREWQTRRENRKRVFQKVTDSCKGTQNAVSHLVTTIGGMSKSIRDFSLAVEGIALDQKNFYLPVRSVVSKIVGRR